MNKVYLEIENCCDCPHHCKEKVYTADSWDHEMGVYCTKVNMQKPKLVVSDDVDVRKYSQVPDWCPLPKMSQEKEPVKPVMKEPAVCPYVNNDVENKKPKNNGVMYDINGRPMPQMKPPRIDE